MKAIPKLILALSVACLIACESGSTLPPELESTSIDGHAVDARIKNGLVQIYTVNHETGEPEHLLAETETDDQGRYSLNVQTDESLLIAVLKGGWYTEEASGLRVDLLENQLLRSYFFHETGRPITITISPATNTAAALASYIFRSGKQPLNGAVTEALVSMSERVGAQIWSVEPADITDNKILHSIESDEVLYGFYLAANSQLTKKLAEESGIEVHTSITSISFSQVEYNDMHFDGLLNGIASDSEGKAQQSNYAGINIESNTYRTQLARALVELSKSEHNKTGLKADDLIPFASKLAVDTGIYGEDPAEKLDTIGPSITALFQQNFNFANMTEFKFELSDFSSVISADAYFNGAFVDEISSSKAFSIDTSQIPDGSHEIRVVATDQFNNVSEKTFTINTRNTGTVVNLTSQQLVNQYDYLARGTYKDQDSNVSTIIVNGIAATIDSIKKEWAIEITLVEGVNTIDVVAIDELNVRNEESFSVSVDTSLPNILSELDGETLHSTALTVQDETATGQTNKQLFDRNPDFYIYYSAFGTALENVALDPNELKSNLIPFFSFVVADEGVVSSLPQNLVVTYQYLAGDYQSIPKPVPSTGNRYFLPLVNEFIDNLDHSVPQMTHEVVIQVTDEAGNESTAVFSFKAFIDRPRITLFSSVRQGNITLHSISNDSKTGALGSCVTSDSGSCGINLATAPQAILVELTNGTDMSFNGSQSKNNQIIRSIFYYDQEPQRVNLNIYTSGAAGFALNTLSRGVEQELAVSEAISLYSDLIGADLNETPVATLSKPNSSPQFDDSYHYAHLLAGADLLIESLASSQISSMSEGDLAQAFYLDSYADQLIDGRENGELILVGSEIFSPTTYRITIPRQALLSRSRSENRTSFPTAEIVQSMHDVSTHHSKLFSEMESLHLDETPPEITAITTARNFSGDMQFRISATDTLTGINTVSYFLNNEKLTLSTESETTKSSLIQNTLIYADGAHNLRVTAENFAQLSTDAEYIVTFDNTAPSIEISSPTRTNNLQYNITGTVEDEFSLVTLLKVGDTAVAIKPDSSFNKNVELLAGLNSIYLEAEDELNNKIVLQKDVVVEWQSPEIDRALPDVVFINPNGTTYKSSLQQFNERDPLYFTIDTLHLGDIPYNDFNALLQANIPFINFDVYDLPSPEGYFTKRNDLEVFWEYKKGNDVVIPMKKWHGDYIKALTVETLHPEFYLSDSDEIHTITLRVIDEAGNYRDTPITFKVFVQGPNLDLVSHDTLADNTFSNTNFNDRAALLDSTIDVIEYTVENPTPVSLKMKIEHEGDIHLQRAWQEGNRQHLATEQSVEEWRSQPQVVTNITSPDQFSTIHYSCDVTNSLAWSNVSRLSYYEFGGGTILDPYIHVTPTKGTVREISLQSDVLPIRAPGSWRAYWPDSIPSTTDQAHFRIDTQTEYDESRKINVKSQSFFYALNNWDGQAPRFIGKCTKPQDKLFQSLQSRNVSLLKSKAGYPKNVVASKTEQHRITMNLSEARLLNGKILNERNGWVTVQPGEKALLTFNVNTPSLVIYNDTELSNSNTKLSYSQKSRLDSSISILGNELETKVLTMVETGEQYFQEAISTGETTTLTPLLLRVSR